MWRYLQHPNLLPLMGAMVSEKQFATVSDWMVNGNINEFVKAHPDVDRLGLVGSHFSLAIFTFLTLENLLVGRRRQGA